MSIVNADLAHLSPKDPDWWRQSVVYQIYPRSFADANGDGKLTPDELLPKGPPPRGPGGGGPGGQRGKGRGQGQGNNSRVQGNKGQGGGERPQRPE